MLCCTPACVQTLAAVAVPCHQAERRAAERAGEEEFRRRMLARFEEEDRLEQMNMQARLGAGLTDACPWLSRAAMVDSAMGGWR